MNRSEEILRLVDEGNDGLASVLIENASVNELSVSFFEDGTNILQCLAARNKPSLIRLIIGKGMNIDMCDNDGVSPLMCAALELSQDAVFTLLYMKACPDLQDNSGMSPLHWSMGCISHDQRPIVKMLLESGANYQLRDYENKTARDIASKLGYKYIVSMIDAEEYKFFLWLSRKIYGRPAPMTLYRIYDRICRNILYFNQTSSQTQNAVFGHVATRGLNYDMFIELMSLF